MMMRSRWARLLAVFTALLLILGACGDDDGGETSEPGTSEDAGDNGDDNGEGDDNGDDEPVGDPEPTVGFDGETITLGVLTPTTGSVAIIGGPLTAGNQAYFDYVNEELGGIAGKYPVELRIEDTAYDPATAGSAYASLREDVAMVLQVLGTDVTNALVPDFEDDNMLASPASLDSAWVAEPNLIPVGAPYQVQAINGIDWYYSQPENEGKVLCTLASDDEYGDTGVAGAEFAAENLGIEIAHQATFPAPSEGRAPQTFTAQLGALEGAGCEVVLFVATVTDTFPLTTALEEGSYNPQILGLSPSWLSLIAGFQGILDNYLLLTEGADYGDESVAGMAELVRIQETYAPDSTPDFYFTFGYLQGIVVHQILEAAVAKGDLSRDGLFAAYDDLGSVSFGDLVGDYFYGPPADRIPPTTSAVFKPNPEFPMGAENLVNGYEASFIGDFVFE